VTFRELYRREVTLEKVRHMIGDGTRARRDRSVSELESARRRFLETYEAAPAKLTWLYPCVQTTLESCTHQRAPFAICTNKQQAATVAVFRKKSQLF
jgi:phosphoglycolate phosphatase-like HAD superfamily hydrolase